MHLETNLETVLEKWKRRMRDRGISAPTGYDQNTIDHKEKHLPKPFPPEIRRLFETFTAEAWKRAADRCPFDLSPVWDAFWYKPEHSAAATADPDWLIFGGNQSSEVLIWCEHFPPNHKHAILGYYIEGGDVPRVFGQSLAQWLDRLLKYDGEEFGFNSSALLESEFTPFEKELFLQHHLTLNPEDKKAVERARRWARNELR